MDVLGGDVARVKRLMYRSLFARDGSNDLPKDRKWDDHATYLDSTIAVALANPKLLGRTGDAASKQLPAIPSLGEISDHPAPDTGWLVQDIWPELAQGFVGGEAKLGKSWLAMALAVSVTTGARFLDAFEVMKTGPVFYLTEESTEAKVRKRFEMLATGHGLTAEQKALLRTRLFPYVRKGVKLTEPAWQRHLLAEQARLSPVMVVIDPLRRYHSNPENQAHDMAPVLEAAAKFKDRGAAVPIVHHMRKASDAQDDVRPNQLLRGSGDLAAWYDAALFTVGVPKVKDRMLVEPDFKDEAAVPLFEAVVTYDPPGDVRPKTSVRLTVGTARNKDELKANNVLPEVAKFLLKWQREHPAGESPNTTQVKQGVGGNEGVVSDTLAAGYGQGYFDRQDGKQNAKHWRLTDKGRALVGEAPAPTGPQDADGDLPF